MTMQGTDYDRHQEKIWKARAVFLDKVREIRDECPSVSPGYIDTSLYWARVKAAFFPELYPSLGGTRRAHEVHFPIVSSFTAEEFISWYAEFFLDRIHDSGMLLDRELVEQMQAVEAGWQELSPRDPTIYPLLERRLGDKGRTQANGGQLNLIQAVLPGESVVSVVAKKVPESLEDLFEQELFNHQILDAFGFGDRVTKPLSSTKGNHVITYGHLAGDLGELEDQPEPVKLHYALRALTQLIHISLELELALKGKHMASDYSRDVQEIIRGKDHTEQYITERFAKNFMLRIAAGMDGVEPSEAPIQEFYEAMLHLRPICEIPYGGDFPHLFSVIRDPIMSQINKSYAKGLAPKLAKLQRLPGHDDFTKDNVLAEKIGKAANGEVYYEGLIFHDVGLVKAPFQNYIWDFAVSANCSKPVIEQLLKITHNRLTKESARRGIDFQASHKEFVQGYRYVSVDKYLKQAALQRMFELFKND